jgi:hypothetical protein
MRNIVRKILVGLLIVALMPVSCLYCAAIYIVISVVNIGDKAGLKRDIRYLNKAADEGGEMWMRLYRGE